MIQEQKKIKVLIVDDSSYMRFVLHKILSSHPQIEVVDMAQDGIEAVKKICDLKPDVVTLDIEMPKLNGIGVLEKLKEKNVRLPVIVFSRIAEEGADVTLKALELGAVDFMTKPGGMEGLTLDNVQKELIQKIKLFSRIDPDNIRRSNGYQNAGLTSRSLDREKIQLKNVIVIASSTGGPSALQKVIPGIPWNFPACVLIVQHMPPAFTKSLSERLDAMSRIEVREAQEGDKIMPAIAYLAKGGYHMRVNEDGRLNLTLEPAVNGVRPAADITMECAAKIYGKKTVGVVLTGMGYDGTKGCYFIKKAGGKTIAEDAKTCVVAGMPLSLVKSGNADVTAPLDKVAGEIINAVENHGEKK